MYRNLIKSLISNILVQKKIEKQITKHSFKELTNFATSLRSLSSSSVYLINAPTYDYKNKFKENPLESDDYIRTYSESNKKTERDEVIKVLRYNFRITESKISKILKDEKDINWNEIKKVLDLLNKNQVYKENIENNPWLLKTSSKLLQSKIDILSSIYVKDINDFIPLFRHSVPRLAKLIKHLADESKTIPGSRNRLYYISDKLNLDAITVCSYLSKRLFVLEMPFEMLQENLNYMIKYGITPLSILKDLWAFRYTPKSVKARLERASDAKKDKIMPWMVRCPERVLQRSLKLSLDEIKILGENNTVVNYISERLDIDVNTMSVILQNHRQVLVVRVTKIKEILDYLLGEEGFSKYDIARVPRVLCHGLETTKARIQELKSIGCRPSSLVILCRSRQEYEKFVNNWLEKQEKIKQKRNSTEKIDIN